MTRRPRGVRAGAPPAVLLIASFVPVSCAGTSGEPATPALAPPRLDDSSRGPGPSAAPRPLPASPLAYAPTSAAVAPPREEAASLPPGVLRRVGGREVTAADLGEHVLRYEPEVALRALDAVAEAVLVGQEAAREGVTVAGAVVDAAAAAVLEERRRALRLDWGAAADLDAVLRERYGRSPEAFRDDVRAAVHVRLLRDRLVRLSQLREDGIEIRVLVLPDEATAAEAARQVRGGADPTLLARRIGARPPASPAPMTRGDVPEPALREALFSAAPGAVLDPVPFDAETPGRDGETTRAWQVFKVVRSWRGSDAPWAEIGPAVEASLASAPVRESEARRWRSALEARADAAPSEAGAAKGLGPDPETR